jgi:hypothetical protein
MALDPTITLSHFLGSLPTFIAVVLAWMHSNRRFSEFNNRFSDVSEQIDDLAAIVRAEGESTRSEFRLGLRRVEDAMGARLKRLEEREH